MKGASMRLLTLLVLLMGWTNPLAKPLKADAIHQMIGQWQAVDARQAIQDALAEDPDDINLQFAQSRLLFFEGNYGESLRVLDALTKNFGDEVPGSVMEFRSRVQETHNALKTFSEHSTSNGRFLIRYKGRDKVLLPYLIPVLEEADKALSADFGYTPKGQVVVEIYPEIAYLARVSPLTESDIETSGTIALCKYNRLMFTSPRALVRGYGWQDTVSHEFVHYYLTKMSKNTIPIWLHEGIAKFQETRWRESPGHKLDPPEEDLLARSLESDKLITFEQMHPSMAKLPSQEAAGLAFAEVHTVIDFLYRKKGYEGLRMLIKKLAFGLEMNAALRSVYGFNLMGLWTAWHRDLKTRGLQEYPGLVQMSLEFKRPGETTDEDELEISYGSIKKKQVRDYTHLGELLRARKRFKAALKEYLKAEAIAGNGNPTVQNGTAESLLALERFKDVPKVLEQVRFYYPRYLRTRLNLATAFLNLEQTDAAIVEFESAMAINPFHPGPHIALEKLYLKKGKADLAKRARESLELLK
ncbi:MAG: peptidase MA family metallohydrolase [Myxococcota bacterium]|nr:peptidase MA family metallohydrolase [Myxococcota bacterium]